MGIMKIAIASDHGGFELKQKMIEYYAKQGIFLDDLGTNSTESCDYPLIARKMTDLSFKDIGESFGKDHSTVIYAIKKV